jgi:hypothetical protein
MRRAAIWCALFLLTAAAAWAAPIRSALPRGRSTAGKVTKSPHMPSGEVLFGDATVEPHTAELGNGRGVLLRHVDRQAGMAEWIGIYVAAGNTGKDLLGSLYANDNGRPGTLLASGSLSSPQAGAWNAIRLQSASVQASQSYWIAVLAKTGELALRNTGNTSCPSDVRWDGKLTALIARAHTAQWSSGCSFSVYVMGTPADPPDALPTVPPVDVVAPAIGGTAQQGDTLSANPGTWLDSPTSYAYQWQDCSGSSCSSISGATSSTYTLQSSDVGDTIDVIVTATNAGGSTSSTSAKTGTVTSPPPAAPANTAAPTISGTPQQGDTLTASNGSWTNSPSSYAFQWQDCSGSSCSSISGATSSTYTLQSSDVGDTIDVIVTATNAADPPPPPRPRPKP